MGVVGVGVKGRSAKELLVVRDTIELLGIGMTQSFEGWRRKRGFYVWSVLGNWWRKWRLVRNMFLISIAKEGIFRQNKII